MKKHPAVKAMLDYYNNRHFAVNGINDFSTCPAANTSAIRTVYPNIVRNGKTQMVEDTQIISRQLYSQCAKHYETGLWGQTSKKADGSKYIYKNTKIKQWLKQPEKLDYVEKLFGKKGLKLYTFLSMIFRREASSTF